jgi:hypothetical protein
VSATKVWVRRQWNDGRAIEIDIDQIQRPHWTDISGGIMKRANRLYLHGYISCALDTEGVLPHSCRHGPPPHRIKICVVKVDNTRAAMAELTARAESLRRAA